MCTRAACFLIFLVVASIAAAQTEFSATVVERRKPTTTATRKIYFGNYKTRLDADVTRGSGAMIMDLLAQTATILTPEQHTYFTGSTERFGPGTLQIYALLRPDDVENACDEWLKIRLMRTETCRKVGREVVNGRRAVNYEGKCSGEICNVWIDRDLRVPVKSERKESSSELRDIREGPQPAELFEIPAGYRQTFTVGGIISKEPH
jgi:hypothetical protein